jgi:hypothetical protein
VSVLARPAADDAGSPPHEGGGCVVLWKATHPLCPWEPLCGP